MASKTRVITLPAPSNVTYGLVRAAGSDLKGFRLAREDPAGYYFKFARGFGWTNPTDLEVTIYQLDAQTSQLRLDASILALADPFGFLTGTLDTFETHLRAMHQASLTGVPPPPPPANRRAIIVNLVIGGVVVGGFMLLLLVFVMLSVLR
jgi:hypothetical protein